MEKSRNFERRKVAERLDGLVARFLRAPVWVLLVVLVACAVLPYANALANGFVYDDVGQVLENQYVRSFRFLPKIFGSSVWSFTGGLSRYYRPLMTFEYLLCYKLFGFSAMGFHSVNIAWHAAVVLLVFLLTRRIFSERWLAFAAAALFALHPVHTESVDWIAAVTDLQLTFFFLLTFEFFLMIKVPVRHVIWIYLAMIASYSLALLSKEQAVTLPVLATAYEHFYRDDRAQTSWRQKLGRYLPLWLLAFAYVVVHRLAIGGLVVTSNYWGLSVKETVFSAVSLFGQYVWKLLWPVHLCAFYIFAKPDSLLSWSVLAGALAGLFFCLVFWRLWKRGRMLSFGLLWLTITLAPVLNPKWLGENVFAERYLYLPSVGFSWIMGWGITVLWRAAAKRHGLLKSVYAGLLVLVAVGWALAITARNRDWHDDVTLYTATLATSPDASLIRANLAGAYKSQGLLRQAEEEYRQVVERDPGCAACMNQLAGLLLEQTRFPEAVYFLKRALQLRPKLVPALVNLGLVYQAEGNESGAEQQFLLAAGYEPANPTVYTALGSLYERQRNYARAEGALQKALLLDPYSASTHIYLGKIYEAEKRPAEAVREFEAALKDQPDALEAIIALRRLRDQRK